MTATFEPWRGETRVRNAMDGEPRWIAGIDGRGTVPPLQGSGSFRTKHIPALPRDPGRCPGLGRPVLRGTTETRNIKTYASGWCGCRARAEGIAQAGELLNQPRSRSTDRDVTIQRNRNCVFLWNPERAHGFDTSPGVRS